MRRSHFLIPALMLVGSTAFAAPPLQSRAMAKVRARANQLIFNDLQKPLLKGEPVDPSVGNRNAQRTRQLIEVVKAGDFGINVKSPEGRRLLASLKRTAAVGDSLAQMQRMVSSASEAETTARHAFFIGGNNREADSAIHTAAKALTNARKAARELANVKSSHLSKGRAALFDRALEKAVSHVAVARTCLTELRGPFGELVVRGAGTPSGERLLSALNALDAALE